MTPLPKHPRSEQAAPAHALYAHVIDGAFEDTIGKAGAARGTYEAALAGLTNVIARIQSAPTPQEHAILRLPSDREDLPLIEEVAGEIHAGYRHLVVIGAGGAGLSGQALSMLRHPGLGAQGSALDIHYLDNIDPHTIRQLINCLDLPHTAFLVISKSGATVETLSQAMVMLSALKRHTANPGRHFYTLSVAGDHPLSRLAALYGMRRLDHDPALCGRFSILSAVGLIPARLAGLDIHRLRRGAQAVIEETFAAGAASEPAKGAALQKALMQSGKNIHVLMPYCDRLLGLAMWHRQSWAESLGKDGQGSTPVRGRGTTDQHSQLQLYLDGPRDKSFTLVLLNTQDKSLAIDLPPELEESFRCLKGRTIADVMLAEQKATAETLTKNGCPLRCLLLNRLDEETLGALLMHFTLEILFIGRLMGVNPFDQPAVEESKQLAREYLLKGSV